MKKKILLGGLIFMILVWMVYYNLTKEGNSSIIEDW